MEFVATFDGQAFQHAGFAVDLNDVAAWAIFSTGGGGTLYARTLQGALSEETTVTGFLLNAPHRYRIEWESGQVRFYVDGS
jgi:hypothetical protein